MHIYPQKKRSKFMVYVLSIIGKHRFLPKPLRNKNEDWFWVKGMENFEGCRVRKLMEGEREEEKGGLRKRSGLTRFRTNYLSLELRNFERSEEKRKNRKRKEKERR